jgi:putative transposase
LNVAEKRIRLGYPVLIHWLRREHWLVINKKRVYRLCKGMGILLLQRGRRRPTLRRTSCNREVVAVTQVWESDIKNSPQFTSRAWLTACDKNELECEHIPLRTPNKNAHIEAFRAILEDECLGRHEFRTFADA